MGLPHVLKVRIDNLNFTVSNDRVVISPTHAGDETLKKLNSIADKLFSKLPYTPITAIGHNYTYELEDNEEFLLGVNFSSKDYSQLYKGIDANITNESELKHSVKLNSDTDLILNIKYKIDLKKYINLNFHYQVDLKKNIVENNINKFYNNYLKSKEILNSLITIN